MRVLTGLAVLIAVFSPGSAFADEPESPYARVATGKPAPKDDDVKIYTNEDLKKMFNIVALEDRETPPGETPQPAPVAETAQPTTTDGSPAPVDALTRMRQRQAAKAEHRKAIAAAQSAVNSARLKLANLERQLLAARNPFSARPELTDEERAKRQEGGETAAQRYERTEMMVAAAREEIRAAEAELARLRAERP